MSEKILHIADCDNIILSFISYVKEKFDFNQHEFLLIFNSELLLEGAMIEKDLTMAPNIHFAKRSMSTKMEYYFKAVIKMNQADKIILHGLFDFKIVTILFFMPWLLKKCYWTIWGGDLYVYQFGERDWRWKVREFFRRPVIKRMGNLVTFIEGDALLARKWYSSKGKFHEVIMYKSNAYKKTSTNINPSSIIKIQIGNSADPSNNHIEVLEKLLPYKDKNICIYVPLSYGNIDYAAKVIKQGEIWFGKKFQPLTEFMPFDEYLDFLCRIDIAIFNHKRQQAMGNIITLLGFGKKVYMRSNTTQWQFFKEKGIAVYDIEELTVIEEEINYKNIEGIKKYFSNENIKLQLLELFE